MERDILILRDPRESIRKCSLTPLRGCDGVEFRVYHPDRRVDAGSRILLDPDGEPFGEEDHGAPLFLIDCAWRRVASLRATVVGDFKRRRLPPLVTAFPRKSRTFVDPEQGLASIEALYAASCLSGRFDRELLRGYRWADEFLELNPSLARPDSIREPS